LIDDWNPTNNEVITWGNSDKPIPTQDWELALFNPGEYNKIYIICDFASIEKHPKKDFFLGTLYVLSGDTIVSEDEEHINKLGEHIKKIKQKYNSKDIQKWCERTEQLIQNPQLYSYEYWGLDSSYVYI